MGSASASTTDSEPRGEASEHGGSPEQQPASARESPQQQPTAQTQGTEPPQEPRFERRVPHKFSDTRRRSQRRRQSQPRTVRTIADRRIRPDVARPRRSRKTAPHAEEAATRSSDHAEDKEQVEAESEGAKRQEHGGQRGDGEKNAAHVETQKKTDAGHSDGDDDGNDDGDDDGENSEGNGGDDDGDNEEDADNDKENMVEEEEEPDDEDEDEGEDEDEDEDESEYEDDGATASDTSLAEAAQPPAPFMGGVSPVVERSSRRRRAAARSSATAPVMLAPPAFPYITAPAAPEAPAGSPQFGHQLFSAASTLPPAENPRGFFAVEGSESVPGEHSPYVDFNRARLLGYAPHLQAETAGTVPGEFLGQGPPSQGHKSLAPLSNPMPGPVAESAQPRQPVPQSQPPLGAVPMQPPLYYETMVYNSRGMVYQGDPRSAASGPRRTPSPYGMPYMWGGQAPMSADSPADARYAGRYGTAPRSSHDSPEAVDAAEGRRHSSRRKRRFAGQAAAGGHKARRAEKQPDLESASSPREMAPASLSSEAREHSQFTPAFVEPGPSSSAAPLGTPSIPGRYAPIIPVPKPLSTAAEARFTGSAEGYRSSRSASRKRDVHHHRLPETQRTDENKHELAEVLQDTSGGPSALPVKDLVMWREPAEPVPYYGGQGHGQVPYVPLQPPYAGYYPSHMLPIYQNPTRQEMQAELEIDGDLVSVTKDWSADEVNAGRRLVRFHRKQHGVHIRLTFEPLDQDDFRDGMTVISCIRREDTQEYFVTSVDCITILELIMGQRFSIEEKNRTRRNLEACRPVTVTKNKPELEPFFRQIMSFGVPRPRNIEKDLKVFLWSNLENALKKIVSKYSAVSHQPRPPP